MRLIGSMGLSSKISRYRPAACRKTICTSFSTSQRVSPAFVAGFSHVLHQFKRTEAFRAISRKYFPVTP